jgi:hypothetical protein
MIQTLMNEISLTSDTSPTKSFLQISTRGPGEYSSRYLEFLSLVPSSLADPFSSIYQLKEISDALGLEGFLIIADQDHRQPYFFQGGSLLSDVFLRGLLDEGDPISRFAVWTAGTKSQIKVTKQINGSVVSTVCKQSNANNFNPNHSENQDGNSGNFGSENNNSPPVERYKGRAENQDVCQGELE